MLFDRLIDFKYLFVKFAKFYKTRKFTSIFREGDSGLKYWVTNLWDKIHKLPLFKKLYEILETTDIKSEAEHNLE